MPLTPKNRKEQWLEGLVQHETALTPKNRPEAWMKEIIDASGGGGGGTGALIVNMDINGALDKTWQEIYDADLAFMSLNTGGMKATGLIAFTAHLGDDYTVDIVTYDTINMSAGTMHFAAESADGYPVTQQG